MASPKTRLRADFPERLFPWLLVAACLVVFSASLAYPFLEGMDDNVYVTRNVGRLGWTAGNVRYWFTHSCVGCYLPLTMLSYMVDHAIWGLNSFGYHLQNLVWHVVAVLGVYACFLAFGMPRRVAFSVCLLFAVHPQRVESVVWISERKDVLCAACYWWSLHAYVRARDEGRCPVWAFVLFALALFAKSMAISLPIVLVFAEIHRSGRLSVRELLKRLWPFFALAVGIVPITVLSQSIPGDQTTFGRQLLVAAYNVLWYAGKTLCPTPLSPIYPKVSLSSSVVGAMAVTYAVLAAGVLFARRRWPRCVAYVVCPLALAYLASAAPILGFVPLGYIDHADRYSYIPSVFLWAGAAGLIVRWLRLPSKPMPAVRLWGRVGLATVAVLFAWLSILHAMAWRDIGALHQMAALHAPPNHFALGTLGDVQAARGDWRGVSETAERIEALDEPWMSAGHRIGNLNKAQSLRATALYRNGRAAEALPLFEAVMGRRDNTAFQVQIDLPVMLAMMADCYLRKGARNDVMRCYDELVAISSDSNYEGCFYRGVRAHYLNDYRTALRWFEEADRLTPGLAQVRSNIADCRNRLAEKARGQAE